MPNFLACIRKIKEKDLKKKSPPSHKRKSIDNDENKDNNKIIPVAPQDLKDRLSWPVLDIGREICEEFLENVIHPLLGNKSIETIIIMRTIIKSFLSLNRILNVSFPGLS